MISHHIPFSVLLDCRTLSKCLRATSHRCMLIRAHGVVAVTRLEHPAIISGAVRFLPRIRFLPSTLEWGSFNWRPVTPTSLTLLTDCGNRSDIPEFWELLTYFHWVSSLHWITRDLRLLPQLYSSSSTQHSPLLLKSLCIQGANHPTRGMAFLVVALDEDVSGYYSSSHSLSEWELFAMRIRGCTFLTKIKFYRICVHPFLFIDALQAKKGAPFEEISLCSCSCPPQGPGKGSHMLTSCFNRLFRSLLVKKLQTLCWDICTLYSWNWVGTNITSFSEFIVNPLWGLTDLTIYVAFDDPNELCDMVILIMGIYNTPNNLFKLTLAHVPQEHVTLVVKRCIHFGLYVVRCDSRECSPHCASTITVGVKTCVKVKLPLLRFVLHLT
jgi:hypothetical protein